MAPKLYCGGQEPVLLAAVAFAAGVIAADYYWRAPHAWLIVFLVSTAGAAFFLRRSPRLAFALGLMAIVPLGSFYLQARDAGQPTVNANLQPFTTGDNDIDVTAYVIREGVLRDSPYGGKQESVDLETEQLQLGDQVLNTAIGIRLTVYSKQADEVEARDLGAESPLRVYTLWTAAALHRQTAHAEGLQKSWCDGPDRISEFARNYTNRFGSCKQCCSTVRLRGHSNRLAAKHRSPQRSGTHLKALAR